MNKSKHYFALVFLALAITACDGKKHDGGKDAPSDDLKVVIIRHGEKPKDGDNLSCQGQNRALKLPAVLVQKIGTPDYVYVPALENDKSTAHSRMFQTASPLAIKYNLSINSKYSAKDDAAIAKSVFKKNGTVLMVWEHSAIPALASALAVSGAPTWEDADFDSIWMISYKAGKAKLALDNEGIKPSPVCNF
ncbi:MAG: histidine phosphatase family protein [Methylophilaceae bacterium]